MPSLTELLTYFQQEMNSKEIVVINNLSVCYDNQHTALQCVDISFYEDDFVGIIGPNGGGKSSLVRAIMGLIPYSGSIRFQGGLEGRHHIGYMPQLHGFDKSYPISVEELVMSGLQAQKGLKRYSKADREKTQLILEKLGIKSLASKQIGELSGGELQRALLGRAIISEPKLLILDEPANFVDNQFEKELYALLEELNKQMAIIVVSHDVGTITSLVKNVVCVNRTVHRHATAELTAELLDNYHCPIQIISHGTVPHTVLSHGDCDAHHHNCSCKH